jgi:hypothetical protein
MFSPFLYTFRQLDGWVTLPPTNVARQGHHMVVVNGTIKKILFSLPLFLLYFMSYSTLLHLPPVRFYWVGGC